MPWISETDANAPGKRLFCLPHAGAGVAEYYRWKRILLQSAAVCPIRLPGRERRLSEPFIPDAKLLVTEILTAIQNYLAAPYAIYGHSMGAILAYELATQIAAAGLPPPICLIVSGRNAPQLEPAHRDLHLLDDEAFLAALRERFGGSQDEVLAVPELRELFLPILRADLKLVETYPVSTGKLTCPIAAFAGTEDHSVSDSGLEGWSEATSATVITHRFPGDHFYSPGKGQQVLLEPIRQLMQV